MTAHAGSARSGADPPYGSRAPRFRRTGPPAHGCAGWGHARGRVLALGRCPAIRRTGRQTTRHPEVGGGGRQRPSLAGRTSMPRSRLLSASSRRISLLDAPTVRPALTLLWLHGPPRVPPSAFSLPPFPVPRHRSAPLPPRRGRGRGREGGDRGSLCRRGKGVRPPAANRPARRSAVEEAGSAAAPDGGCLPGGPAGLRRLRGLPPTGPAWSDPDRCRPARGPRPRAGTLRGSALFSRPAVGCPSRQLAVH